MFQGKLDTPRVLGEREGPISRAYMNSTTATNTRGPTYAIQIDATTWTFGNVDGWHTSRTLPSGDRAIGVLSLASGRVVLITLKSDRERLAAMSSVDEQIVVRESQPLLAWAVSHSSPHVAYLTQTHELVVLEAKGGGIPARS